MTELQGLRKLVRDSYTELQNARILFAYHLDKLMVYLKRHENE